MMYVVQIFLPLQDNDGKRFPPIYFDEEMQALSGKFGGVTAFSRMPAKGIWKEDGGTITDNIIILEVMTPNLDEEWWRDYRRGVEGKFSQDEIVIRALSALRI